MYCTSFKWDYFCLLLCWFLYVLGVFHSHVIFNIWFGLSVIYYQYIKYLPSVTGHSGY